MTEMNPEAEQLNKIINDNNPTIFEMLSEKGKAIYYPKRGMLKQGAEASGKKINATIGFAVEDDGSPMRLPSIANLLSLDPCLSFPYAPSYGIAKLRKRWQELIIEKNPSLKEEISLPIVTNGLTHGLSMIGYLFVNPGDKIIVSDIYWGNYNLVFENAYESELIFYNTFNNNKLDIQSFEKTLSENSGKQILIMNFPNNPTGYSSTLKETEEIVSVIKQSAEDGNQLLVIMDDAYFGLVYESGIDSESIFSRLAGLHENILAVKIDGSTKEDYVWGFRVGFITYGSKGLKQPFYQALVDKTAGAIRGNISSASHLSQSLVLQAFNSPTYEEEKQAKYNLLKSRYDKVKQILNDNPKYEEYFKPLPFNSGYFMCMELTQGLDAEMIRQRLLMEYDTGVIATKKLIRIAFSSVAEKNIPEIFENIYTVCKIQHTN